jgi:antibiotic biosynthesis monooxygenase (ABM) superfamily enzyme
MSTAVSSEGREGEPVSSVIFRTVKPGRARTFEELAREVNAQLRRFPGHLGVDVIAPPPGERMYAVIVRFDGVANLKRWKESPELATFVARVDPICEPDSVAKGLTGMEGWIAIPGRTVAAPPRWKSVIVSFLAAYPAIALLQALVLPHFGFLPGAAQGVLLGLLMCIALTYVLMPLLTRILAKWLYPR